MSIALTRFRTSQEGSVPLALLAAIVVAGLVSVLTVRIVAGEEVSRFDRNFTETLHVADGGLNQALFWFNSEATAFEDTVAIGAAGPTNTATIDGITYEWSSVRTGYRTWDIVSRSEVTGDSGASRTVVARFDEKPRFFPGAFGDTVIAFNGTSSKIDSYNPTCDDWSTTCRWGSTTVGNEYTSTFGTGNGSIGTNEVLDLSGNVDIRPDSAFLYDWKENPGEPIGDPNFGDRCIQSSQSTNNRCTETYVETVDDPLDFASPARMSFITSKFNGGVCDSASTNFEPARMIGGSSLGSMNPKIGVKGGPAVTLSPYQNVDDDDPTHSGFTNFYCADSIEFLGNMQITGADADTPVVIFVRDLVKIPNSGTNVGCYRSTTACPDQDSNERAVRPFARNFQIYVAGLGTSDVFFKSQVRFAGIVYAPKSRCGGSGNAGADVYGLMMCGSMDNVGNWDFHFDDSLGNFGTGLFDVAYWQEDASAAP